MNTATYRNAALDAAAACNWAEAARLLRLAIDAYPVPRGRNDFSPMQRLDIARMEERLRSFEDMTS
jgi:hypothetical protein